MRTTGALFEDFVVPLLVLFDQALQGDVAPGLDPTVVAREQKQETRNTAIAIAEGMNTEKIQVQSGGENQRMNPFLPHAALPKFNYFSHAFGRRFCGPRFEADAAAAISVS